MAGSASARPPSPPSHPDSPAGAPCRRTPFRDGGSPVGASVNESFLGSVRLQGRRPRGGTMTPQPTPSRFAGLAGDLIGDDPGSAPLLLLHGLTYDRRSWQPVLRELRHLDPDRRVLSLDLPG